MLYLCIIIIETMVATLKFSKNKMTTKNIFNHIQGLNPKQSTVSSIGSFVSASSQMVADNLHKEIIGYIPSDSLAYKILSSTQEFFTEKQLWVISFELAKNSEFCSKLEEEVKIREAEANQRKQASNDKLKANKENSSDVLSQVKEAGLKLGDYYSFVKSNKKFAKEFYSKKFSQESVNEFINK